MKQIYGEGVTHAKVLRQEGAATFQNSEKARMPGTGRK